MTTLNNNLINRIALGDIFRRRAVDAKNRIAIKMHSPAGVESITYRELNDRLNQFVRAMRQRALGKGDRIAILGRNSIDFYIAILGCYKGGFVAVPINYLQGQGDLAYILDHAECRGVLFDSDLAGRIEPALDKLQPVVAAVLDKTGNDAYPALGQLIASQPATEIEDVIIEDGDPAQIMYTSGTTSRPKGVVASHKSLFLSSINVFILANVTPDQTNQYVPLPLFHLTALTFSYLTLHLGGTVSLAEAFNAEQAVRIFDEDRIHVTVLAPMMWRAIAHAGSLPANDVSSLRCGFYGMAPMDQDTLDRLRKHFSCHFLMASGQTEIGGASTGQSPYWSTRKVGNYWGGGSVFCDQAIMDDNGNPLPANETGEIVWRSPMAMNEYFRNSEATAEVSEFGWHHSGDLGFIDEDNQLCFVDRKKDIIKTGGENVSSVLVERVILALPGIANAAVIGVPHRHWGEAIVAIVITEPPTALTEADVIEHCRKSLGGFQIPKKVIFRQSIPVTATGKIQKAGLREAWRNLFPE